MTTGPSNLPEIRAQVLATGELGGPDTITTTPNADGSITTHYTQAGMSVSTTFARDGTITEVFGPPLSRTRITRFTGTTITESTT